MQDLKNFITGRDRISVQSFINKYIQSDEFAKQTNLDEVFEAHHEDLCKTVSLPPTLIQPFFSKNEISLTA